MVRAADRLKMDACAFNLKLRGVELDEGIDEIMQILMECDIDRDGIRVVADKKGRGVGVYHEVSVDTDAGQIKWWRSTKSKGARDGTLMVKGEERFSCGLWRKLCGSQNCGKGSGEGRKS